MGSSTTSELLTWAGNSFLYALTVKNQQKLWANLIVNSNATRSIYETVKIPDSQGFQFLIDLPEASHVAFEIDACQEV